MRDEEYYETLGVEKLDRFLEFQNSTKLFSYKNSWYSSFDSILLCITNMHMI